MDVRCQPLVAESTEGVPIVLSATSIQYYDNLYKRFWLKDWGKTNILTVDQVIYVIFLVK